jgi:hypothetical protein
MAAGFLAQALQMGLDMHIFSVKPYVRARLDGGFDACR